jgi:hypothetical protein
MAHIFESAGDGNASVAGSLNEIGHDLDVIGEGDEDRVGARTI